MVYDSSHKKAVREQFREHAPGVLLIDECEARGPEG
jgi:hypothetical protein